MFYFLFPNTPSFSFFPPKCSIASLILKSQTGNSWPSSITLLLETRLEQKYLSNLLSLDSNTHTHKKGNLEFSIFEKGCFHYCQCFYTCPSLVWVGKEANGKDALLTLSGCCGTVQKLLENGTESWTLRLSGHFWIKKWWYMRLFWRLWNSTVIRYGWDFTVKYSKNCRERMGKRRGWCDQEK